MEGIGDVFEQDGAANGQQQQLPPNWNYQYEAAVGRQRADFKKLAPSYIRTNMSWDQYMDLFTTEKSDYSLLTDEDFKKILYSKLTGEAFQMASPEYHPLKPDLKPLTFQHYAKKLGNLFEPESESGQAKLIFEQRIQLQGEHPADYFQNKLGLFHRAYKRSHRDYQFFYNKVIVGLVNQEMRNFLRLQIPKPVENFKLFRESMMEIATVVRRKYLDGEIGEAEAMGAESYAIVQSVKTNQARNEAINALTGQKPKGHCYFCRSREHYIAQCPRKAAGLPAVVSSFGDKKEVPTVVNKNKYQGVKNTMGTSFPSSKPRNNYQHIRKQKGRTGRIMFVYEDIEGELQCEPVEEEEGTSDYTLEEKEDKTDDAVNMIEDAEDHSEGDYIPGSFLGQN